VIEIVVVDQELGVPFISVSAPSIVSGMSGESEKTLRETFEEAKVRLYFFWFVGVALDP
jgi:SpoVK/Ycf46/Vps4 family AAA+-type ATPase